METVLVVGGGVIGSAVALALSRRRLKVTLLERGRVEPSRLPGRGPEGSSAAAGILGAQLEGLHGDGPLTRLCLESLARYPSWAEELYAQSGLDVELRPVGVLEVAFETSALAALLQSAAWQRQAGLPVEELTASDVRSLEPSLSSDVAGGVRFPRDARIDPPSLLAALRITAERSGVVLRPEATVARALMRSGRVTGVELADGATIEGDAVVIAAGSWSPLIGEASLSDRAIRPARGQMVELKLPAPVLRGVVEGPRCYFSPRDDGRILVGSTIEFVGFRPGITAAAVRDLLIAATRLLPALGDAPLERAWSGFRPCSADGHPLIGATDIKGLIIATGHHRNGVLLAPITGEIVAALLAGEVPPVDLGPFNPRRQMSNPSSPDLCS